METKELAIKINQFYKDFDLYGYNDTVEDEELEIKTITEELINDKNKHTSIITDLFNDDVLSDDSKKDAEEIINQIDSLI